MVPKKKTSDKVPTGTSDAVDSGSTPNVAGGNDPTLDPGKDPSQAVSATSETNTICPTTWSTCVTDQLAQPASEWGTSEDPTQTPNPHGGSGDPFLPKTYSDYSEPSERSTSADPDPEELALGDQIQEMLDTINEHMDEVKTIHNMSCQAAQLLVKTNESNSALEARTRTLRTQLIVIREKYLMIAKGNWLNNPVDEESTNGQPNIDHELMQSTLRPNNRSGTKHALSKARTELSAKTAILEQLYADQAPEGHLNQAATTARNTYRQQSIPPSKNTRIDERWENPHKSVHYAPFDGIEDNDTDSETTVRNHREGSIPFQHLDDRDILDMSNNEGDNPLVRMVKYMLDQNINTTMEKSSLAKAGVKVTPPDKYSGEQSFEALETFVNSLLRWLDMHSMLGPDAYKYQVLFLGTRLEGKALEWFNKTVKPRKYQGTPMDLEQVVTGLYGQYIPSLARHEVSNRFDLIKQGTLSVQEFTTELKLYVSRMVQRPDAYSLRKKFVDNLQPGLQSLLLRTGYDPEKKMIHKLYLKAVKLKDTNHYDIGAHNSEPTTSNSRWDDNVSSNNRHKTRNNGPNRTKSRTDPSKSGETNKGSSLTPGPSGVNRNLSTAPSGAGPPIHNRQWTNHQSSHNSIECYNCGKSGHIKPNCLEPIRAHCVGAVHVEDSPEGQVDNADIDIK
ncbi:hypothetical protein M422DRAFT_258999 [Sphaerobolus stellatus SS14]|uniref:CCHC-type domain-containing protein n=1 Tax=Sphaerobolus stellatus (strain SS14) TaxID=990650 RepID=A0A0C9U5U6_SPHS4|nr:hypothetical protein M422DRAFT_258999 [Sphaerobolus stellatus SS14]